MAACLALGPNFAELGREFRVVDAGEHLALLNDGAFLHEDLPDHTAFERLHHLGLSRRHDTSLAALDLVQHGEMRPGHAAIRSRMTATSSMREVRGVRSSAAARISLAKAKSDCTHWSSRRL